MRNLLAVTAALVMMAGFSAFAQDGAAPGQTPAADSAASAPAKMKKSAKKGKKGHHGKKQKKEESK